MQDTFNITHIQGRVGADPIVRVSQQGYRSVSFRIATEESWKNKTTGEYDKRTEWHNVRITKKATVDYVERHVKQGDLVRVYGMGSTNVQEKNGKKTYFHNVVVKGLDHSIAIVRSRSLERSGPGTAGTEETPSLYDSTAQSSGCPEEYPDEIPL